MIQVGSYNSLAVKKRLDFGLILGNEFEEVLLPRKYTPDAAEIGEILRVFVYTDSEDRPVATTRKPKAIVGEFAWLRVKDVNRHGAFLDWGLDKDLFVPFGEQRRRMEEGEKYIVRVCRDDFTDRVMATSNIEQFFNDDPKKLKQGQAVSLMIYDETPMGFKAIIENEYTGVLYKSETYSNVRIGEKLQGYIKQIRPDRKIDVTLRRVGAEAISNDKERILKILVASQGVLPFHDKSAPEEIQNTFRMSKKAFKRAIGGLYKDGLISLDNQQITLIEK